ncbi:MAG: hypothetical protein WAM82_15785 [Thermoanaerobaculia bacterium]
MTVLVRRVVLACVLSMGASLVSPDLLAQSCGVERWSVKTGTDADIGRVNVSSSSPNTIVTMRGWTAPNPIPPNNRVSPFETTVWVLNATLTQYKLESDSDYHLVLSDASGNTLIAEIPLPACVGSGSPFLSGITNARTEFNARFTPTTSFQTANIPVQIKGVGMFDFLHGQTGVAPNGIELHPVLDVIFNPTSDFSISASPASVSAAQGFATTTTVSTSVAGSFNSAISLSASGVPAGASASFSPTSIAAPGSGSSTLTLSAGTAAVGTYTITVTGTGGGKTHTTTVSFQVTSSGSPDFALSVSPSSVSAAAGTNATATASTTVSGGFNSAVALSVSGVPTGASASFSPASIAAPGPGSSTLTIATGTAAAGTYNLTITGTGGGKTHTAPLALTVTAGGGTQVLVNPGFESGNTTWVASSGVINTSTSEPAHGGSWKAWLDGYGTTHTDTLYQQVAIFSSHTSATLTFWLHIDTAETSTTTAFDTLQVQVRSSSGTLLQTLATYSNLDAKAGYAQKTFNLAAYIGQTIRVYLVGAEDSVKQTSFVVDDFALNVQ